jgi:hypothetical protein
MHNNHSIKISNLIRVNSCNSREFAIKSAEGGLMEYECTIIFESEALPEISIICRLTFKRLKIIVQ